MAVCRPDLPRKVLWVVNPQQGGPWRLSHVGLEEAACVPALTQPPLPAVKEKLRLDPDSEIATTGVRVSLICPVSRCGPRPHSGAPGAGGAGPGLLTCSAPQLVKMRLSVPCRAETCAHLQCFDAVFYLQMNEKKPTWMCPVCDKPAPYDQLIIDG